MTNQFTKDPLAVLDYKIDWSDWLGTDTITSSTWTVQSGITETISSNTTTTATIWLAGGRARNSYAVTNNIITAGGRKNEQTIVIPVENT